VMDMSREPVGIGRTGSIMPHIAAAAGPLRA
jgi:hypothetical protein